MDPQAGQKEMGPGGLLPSNFERLVFLGDMLSTWDKIAADRDLKSDSEIACFLVRYYEDTYAGNQSASRCVRCLTPLSLSCANCGAIQKPQLPERHTPRREDFIPAQEHGGFLTPASAAFTTSSAMPVPVAPELPSHPGADSMDEAVHTGAGDSSSSDRESREQVAPPTPEHTEAPSPNISIVDFSTERVEAPPPTPGETSVSTPYFMHTAADTPNVSTAGQLSESETVEKPREENTAPPSDAVAGKHVCPHCGSKFAYPRGLQYHLSLQICYTPPKLPAPLPVKTYKCMLCPHMFHKPELLAKHMDVHLVETPTNYKCPHCGAGFEKKSVMILHLKKHAGRHTCQHCNVEFTSMSGLTIHLKSGVCKGMAPSGTGQMAASQANPYPTHPKYRAFQSRAKYGSQAGGADNELAKKSMCKFCGKKMASPYHLKRHLLIHTGERPFGCQECGASFTQKSGLIEHFRRKHSSFRDKPVKCGTCSETFTSTLQLDKHVCPNRPPIMESHYQQNMAPSSSQPGYPPCELDFSSAHLTGMSTPHLPTVDFSQISVSHIPQEQPPMVHNTVTAAPVMAPSLTLSVTPSTAPSLTPLVSPGEFINRPPTSSGRPFRCTYCSAEFAYNNLLIKHIQKHTGRKEFRCPHCEAAFREAHHLAQHLVKHDRDQSKTKTVQCKVCKKSLSSPGTLEHHVCVRCEVCQSTFKNKSALKTHMRTHTGEKPYLCTECGKGFAQYSNLKRHRRTHTGQKPYTCQLCAKNFVDSSGLRSHMQRHTGLKPHKCSLCGKSYRERYLLTMHMRSHTMEKPYKCGVCDAKFSIKSSLTGHMRTHTGEKPYECPHCGRKFAKSCNRAAHIRTHKHGGPRH